MKKHTVIVLLIAIALILSSSAASVFAKDDSEVVKEFLRKQIIFDDFVKLKECVDENDPGRIFMCILEIYPDFVVEMRKCSGTPDQNAASLIAPFNPMILAAAGGVAAGAAGTLIVTGIKRRKAK